MSAPAPSPVPLERHVVDVPGQLPDNVRLGRVHRRDLQDAEHHDADVSDQQADGQSQEWFGDTAPLPVFTANDASNGRPQNGQDNEMGNSVPNQERARRAHLTHLRHHAGARAAGLATSVVLGREAGRQAHDQILARGEGARAEADANVGAWRHALATRFAGLVVAAREFGADRLERHRQSERLSELEHEAYVRRMGGEQASVDPIEYARAEQAVRAARVERAARRAQPAQPVRPASTMAPPVLRRYGPEEPEAPGDDQVSGIINHLRHGEYELPRFGQEGNLTPQHYMDDDYRANTPDDVHRDDSETPDGIQTDLSADFYIQQARKLYARDRDLLGNVEPETWIHQQAHALRTSDQNNSNRMIGRAIFDTQRQDPAYQQEQAAQREATRARENDPHMVEARRLFERDLRDIPEDQREGWVERTAHGLRENARQEAERQAALQQVRDAERARKQQEAVGKANRIADTFGEELKRNAARPAFPANTGNVTAARAMEAAEGLARYMGNNYRDQWEANGLNNARRRAQVVRGLAATIVRMQLGKGTERLLAAAFARELFGAELTY